MNTVDPPLAHSLSRAERDTIRDWLAASLNRPGDAHQQWKDGHIAVLALGRRFSAVRLPEALVCAVAAAEGSTVSSILRTLNGPVIHDPYGHRFYALVPSSPGSELGPYAKHLGLGHYLGVPRVGDHEPDGTHASYWVVPLRAPHALCDPARLATLIETGAAALGSEDQA
ncbi:hypothetical protein DT019_08750 [Streptomyces sp. SDr-06]|uniref:hypothetical protein n=1 Tax=Streptomyces sp. SDr-06 TaxID=2267702 RepID=UPI000DEA9013|nr:hypothetical protein [Streptomyces sp. SDr-06]RCH68749.1 hypothetical protein DT019_08750 [Streptomyces sp. SDr-06]